MTLPSLPPSVPQNAHKTDHKTAVRGMVCAFFGFLFFSCQDALLSINTQHYPAMQLAWMNCVTVLTTLVMVLLVRKGWRGLKIILYTDNTKIHIIRGLMLAVGTVFAFTAIRDVPLPNFYTIIFIGPLLAVSLSGLFLKEPIGVVKMLALLVGFIGLVVALRPGVDGFNTHSLYVVCAAFLFGGTALLGRFLGRKDTALSLIFYPVTLLIVCLAIPVAFMFVPIVPEHLFQVLIMGVFTTAGFFCNAYGYKMAPLYMIAPCQFLQFFWGSIANAVIHKTLPDATVAFGALLIIGSNILIIYLQSRQQQKG
jgi:drug/metabolite transporter (DMT)-like permease